MPPPFSLPSSPPPPLPPSPLAYSVSTVGFTDPNGLTIDGTYTLQPDNVNGKSYWSRQGDPATPMYLRWANEWPEWVFSPCAPAVDASSNELFDVYCNSYEIALPADMIADSAISIPGGYDYIAFAHPPARSFINEWRIWEPETFLANLTITDLSPPSPPPPSPPSPSPSPSPTQSPASVSSPSPPSLAPGASHQYSLTSELTVAGDPSDFTDSEQAALKSRLASELGVSEANIQITVAAGSTLISIALAFATHDQANNAVSWLSSDVNTLSARLGVTVLSAVTGSITPQATEAPPPPPTLLHRPLLHRPPSSVPSPSPPPAADAEASGAASGSSGIGIGIGVGIGVPLLLGLCYVGYRYRSRSSSGAKQPLKTAEYMEGEPLDSPGRRPRLSQTGHI